MDSYRSDKWYIRYQSIPFKDGAMGWDGSSCWGMVRLVYKEEQNIILPEYLEPIPYKPSLANMLIQNYIEKWDKVVDPKPFDLYVISDEGVPAHIGLVVDSTKFIHTSQRLGGTVISPSNRYPWRTRILGTYRYNELRNR